MHRTLYSLILPIIFILHNYEELKGFGQFRKVYFKSTMHDIVDQEAFKFAIILLNLLVAIIFIMNYLIETHLLQIMCLVITLAILLNALQHIGISLYHRKLAPGIYTSLILTIPYVGFLITSNVDQAYLKQNFLALCLYSVITLIFSIYISLTLGQIFNLFFQNLGGK